MTDAPTLGRAVLPVDALDALIGALRASGFTVIGPTVRDGAIVQAELTTAEELPVGWSDVQEAGTYRLVRRDDDARFGYAVGPHSPRRQLQPPRETLVSIRSVAGRLTLTEAPSDPVRHAFLGVRACDLAAIAVQDRVLADGAHADPRYVHRREETFVVAVQCSDPAATCFCASMGTGPAVSAGFDLALTELLGEDGHRFLVEVGTERGAAVLAELRDHVASARDRDVAAADEVVRRSAERMGRRLDPDAARHDLQAKPEHPRWDDVAARCLSCTNCTLVCPTCFCSSVEDRSSLDGTSSERVQRWESCFSLDHSYLHGAGPVRSDIRSRYRQWLTHKLSTWWDQFGTSGCVGCGRCITWCPAGIDLTEEAAAMAATSAAAPEAARAGHRLPDRHGDG